MYTAARLTLTGAYGSVPLAVGLTLHVGVSCVQLVARVTRPAHVVQVAEAVARLAGVVVRRQRRTCDPWRWKYCCLVKSFMV